MAKYNLNHFNTRAGFNEKVPNPDQSTGNDFWNNLVFIKDTKEIYTHGQFYDCSEYDDTEVRYLIFNLSQETERLDADKANVTHEHSYTDLLSNNDPNKILVSTESNFILKDINDLIGVTDTSKQLKFYCVEPVTIDVNGVSKTYNANSAVNLFFKDGDIFTITPTSNSSILTLDAWPGYLDYYYDWLEGVQTFTGIIFNMNDAAMYTKWNQGNQGVYKVQFAQYINCVFWSDNPYISDVSLRTNYTLYYSEQLPLCYSTIPENTFKAFYCAYGVKNDPNWSNPVYRESFSLATHATQVFSYYGAHFIGIYNMDSSRWNIPLPKDCRGLMFAAPNIMHAGVFDASKTTNFGAKSGSWREAFGLCSCLSILYIKNLKASLNLSWSPIALESLEYIIDNATNTSKIYIYLSPFTWYRLTDDIKAAATAKNITLSLIDTNYTDDLRFGLSVNKIEQELTDDEKDIVHKNLELDWIEY